MPCERVERAHLRDGIVHSRYASGDHAQFFDVDDGTVVQIKLRDLHVVITNAGDRLQHSPTRRLIAKARENADMTDVAHPFRRNARERS